MSRYLAIQFGARRAYAVPEILEKAGMLERFYTDVCGNSGFGRASAWLQYLPSAGRTFRRLHNRRLPNSIISKTQTFAIPAFRHAIDNWRMNGNLAARFRSQIQQHRNIGDAMARAGFGQATHLYSMLGEGGPCLVEARRRGLTVVSEVYILLSTERILGEERRAFPGWEADVPDYEAIRRELSPDNALLTCSDFFICPSEAVRDDLILNWGIEAFRTRIVPYGVDPHWLKLSPQPVKGRVLFVGTADLRKGIHYFAMAAEQLKKSGHNYDFQVAGNVSPAIAQRHECQHLGFLGRVPRNRIGSEFEQADVFVLPSLAEGSAEATYEALATGLPVVTTTASGSVVRHGIDGFIVPERDSHALAEAIAQIIEDRALRARISNAARERAREYTWDRYGDRLIAALRDLPGR